MLLWCNRNWKFFTRQVEASYDGPHLGDEGVTLDFVTELIEHFRSQHRLHRKYVYSILLQIIPLLRSLPTLVDVPVAKGQHITVRPSICHRSESWLQCKYSDL